jgi:hypothetical protein
LWPTKEELREVVPDATAVSNIASWSKLSRQREEMIGSGIEDSYCVTLWLNMDFLLSTTGTAFGAQSLWKFDCQKVIHATHQIFLLFSENKKSREP